MKDNTAMRDYWNGEGGRFWAARREVIHPMLEPFGDAIRATLAPQPGERILDVGCGDGPDTIEIARAVAPGGEAVGVDISAYLIDEARVAAKEAGVEATFLVGDGQGDALPGPFDAVFSRFGVMFFAEPERAFANLRAATRAGGRLAFICWQAGDSNPMSVVAFNAVADILELPPPPPPDAPGPAAFANRDRAHTVVTGGGWRDVFVEPFTTTRTLAADIVLERLVDMGPARAAYYGAPPETQRAALDALSVAIERFRAGDGYTFPQAAWIVTARNA